MATTTRSRLRALMGPGLGFFFSSTTTGTVADGGATITDTALSRFNSTQLVEQWVYIVDGDSAGEAQRISSVSDDANGVVTLVRSFPAAIASGVAYLILAEEPSRIHLALEQAIRRLNGKNPLWLSDETLVVDNLVQNPLFATFAGGAFTNWTSIGTPTIAQNTDYFWHGSQSANITPGSANEGLEQNLLTAANGWGRIDRAGEKTLHLIAALRATVASSARLRVTFDGTTYTDDAAYHSGDDDWEGPTLHRIDVAIPANPTEMTVSVEGATTDAFQGGMVVGWIDRIHRYTVPTSFVYPHPHFVYQQRHEDRPNGEYVKLTEGAWPTPGRILRLEGMGRLSVPTTDAGTVELDETQGEILAALATRILNRTMKNVDTESREERLQDEREWDIEADRLRASVGDHEFFHTVNRRQGWRVQKASGVSYLLIGKG